MQYEAPRAECVAPSLRMVPPLIVPALALAFVGLVQGAGVSANFLNPDGWLRTRLPTETAPRTTRRCHRSPVRRSRLDPAAARRRR